jgi:hypothetical protein
MEGFSGATCLEGNYACLGMFGCFFAPSLSGIKYTNDCLVGVVTGRIIVMGIVLGMTPMLMHLDNEII